ncbi:hypothetical protein WA026_014661 [Henosepilachna vigintioctopunctata]|uniref:Phosphatidic acid phosphatase type 2/haloperoxidase domain-containing protein n=1 Tax=Henosepilachna vigintioctopunctata TaxID=420089 RepID=A0AAW1V7Y3_9CUCU
MSKDTKDRVPPTLKKVLEYDKILTKLVIDQALKFVPLRSLRTQYKLWSPSLIQLQVNMLLGLLLDVILVAVCKAYFRRRRPVANKDDALGQIGPDVYSFPSGHASSICISRLLMYRHYLLDVVGGVILGLLEGIIMSILWLSDDSSKYLFSFLSDEKLDGGEFHV